MVCTRASLLTQCSCCVHFSLCECGLWKHLTELGTPATSSFTRRARSRCFTTAKHSLRPRALAALLHRREPGFIVFAKTACRLVFAPFVRPFDAKTLHSSLRCTYRLLPNLPILVCTGIIRGIGHRDVVRRLIQLGPGVREQSARLENRPRYVVPR